MLYLGQWGGLSAANPPNITWRIRFHAELGSLQVASDAMLSYQAEMQRMLLAIVSAKHATDLKAAEALIQQLAGDENAEQALGKMRAFVAEKPLLAARVPAVQTKLLEDAATNMQLYKAAAQAKRAMEEREAARMAAMQAAVVSVRSTGVAAGSGQKKARA